MRLHNNLQILSSSRRATISALSLLPLLLLSLCISGCLAASSAPSLPAGTLPPAVASRISIPNPGFPGDVNAVGSATAPVQLVIFQDLKCGMCARAYKRVISELNKSYIPDGQVRLVYMEFPLGMMTEERLFAEAAKCMAEQGAYAKFVDYLYLNMKETKAESIKKYAKDLGADSAKFDACFDSGRYGLAVKADFNTGTALKVEGTPTMFMNGKEVRGAMEWEEFKALLAAELGEVKK